MVPHRDIRLGTRFLNFCVTVLAGAQVPECRGEKAEEVDEVGEYILKLCPKNDSRSGEVSELYEYFSSMMEAVQWICRD